MASMTVRGLDEDVKRRFVQKARSRGLSVEAYHRLVVAEAATEPNDPTNDTDGWLDEVLERARALNLTDDERAAMEEGMASFRADRTP